MNKIKSLMLVTALFVASIASAQSMEEGKKLMYYEKYKSAKNVFEKIVATNPNDEEAVYWLGQSMILPEYGGDIAGAKALYQKALMANSNSPLLIAGMGHIELLEGKKEDARNRFETAISLSKGKSIPVLNAIGFANVNAKDGDATYAIEKLKLATNIRKFDDPSVYTNIGDAYRKFADGGNALQAYEAALRIDPNYARASYRIGKIYQTQGYAQEEIYMKYFNQAIEKDPSYAPVYENLYQLFYTTNVSRSAENLDKYLALMGDDAPGACYLKASMKYAQGHFAEVITEADKCLSGATQPYPNLYGLKGYAYNRLGDSMNAKASFDQYFQKQKPEKIGPTDYSTYASVLLKFPGNETLAGTYVDKAVEMDSTEEGKVNQLKLIATTYETRKLYKEAADWYKKIVNIKKTPGKLDLYYAGYGYYRSGNYKPAIEVFDLYTQKFPDDIFGYYMVGKSNWGIDTSMTLGLANPAFEKAIEVGEAITDSVAKSKVQSQLIGSYKYMIAYAANIKKDKAEALAFTDKALLLDPTDEELLANREAISNMKGSSSSKPSSKSANAESKANGASGNSNKEAKGAAGSASKKK